MFQKGFPETFPRKVFWDSSPAHVPGYVDMDRYGTLSGKVSGNLFPNNVPRKVFEYLSGKGVPEEFTGDVDMDHYGTFSDTSYTQKGPHTPNIHNK